MTSLLSRALPPPNNWQDFERLSFDLFSRLWKTNDVEMNGRLGQPQAGVDIYGTDRVENKFAGVQCKGKQAGYSASLTEAELRSEIEKAKAFIPPLDVFTVVTTANNDAELQRIAREITLSHKSSGLFEVRVQGWQTLVQRITDFPELTQKHFPDFAPFDVVEKLSAIARITEQEGETTRALVLKTQEMVLSVVGERPEAGDPLKPKIDQAIKLVEDGFPRAALAVYERLWKDEGDQATPRSRYRLLANMGNVHMLLGRSSEAVELFRRAYAEDPEWPGAIAISATASLLDGDRGTAYILAADALAKDPTLEQAVIVYIDTAPDALSVQELEVALPQALQESITALLGLSMRARNQGNLAAAESYARSAGQKCPTDWRPMAALAEALFTPISEIEGVGFTHQIPDKLRSRFNEALELLRHCWAILESREDAIRGLHVAANLWSGLNLVGLKDEAGAVLDAALKIGPSNPTLLRMDAQTRAENNDWPGVIRSIDAISVEEREPTDQLVRVQGLTQIGRHQEALDQASELVNSFDDERYQQIAGGMQLEAAARLGLLESTLEGLLKRWPGSVLLRSVAISLLPSEDPKGVSLAAELDQLVASITDPRDRFHAAEALYRSHMFSRAADLYEGLHGTDHTQAVLSRRLRALYFADRRAEARALFESLPDKLKLDPEYAEVGIAIYHKAGLPADARILLERQLEVGENLETRLRWLSVVDRMGDEASAVAWLETVDPSIAGNPTELMVLATALDHHIGDKRSLPIAYRALRQGYGDQQIQLGYTVGLFIMGRVGRGVFPTPTQAANDVVVVLENVQSRRRLTRIIETESDPRIDRDEIAPDNPLAIRLIGLRVGDEIEIESAAPEPAQYRVVELHDKYLFVHFRSMQAFPTMFPESRAFGSFELDDSLGDEKFQPLFDTAKRRHEFTEKILEAYVGGSIPIGRLAELSGTSPLDVWESLRHQPGVEMPVAFGTNEEFSAAALALSENRSAIIDAVTLFGLVQLEIADAIRSSFFDLAVVQTSIDLLRSYLDEQELKRGTQQGSFGWNGQAYTMVELSEEAIEKLITGARAALDFALTLTVIPAESVVGLLPESKEIFEAMHPSFMDTAVAAKGSGRLLLCDDRITRILISGTADVKGVWTQASCKFAVESDLISRDAWFDANAALADAGYTFTMIGHQDVLHQLSKNRWTLSPLLNRFILLLCKPTNDQNSVSNLLAQLAFFGWRDKPSTAAFEVFFQNIFAQLASIQPDLPLTPYVQSVFDKVAGLLSNRARQAYFKRWLKRTTEMTPVAVIAQRVETTGGQIGNRIAESLSKALDNARGPEPATP